MAGNIVLCGFMGCGKTTVGKRTAKLMKRSFCDLDEYIEQKAGMTISDIFAQQGEAAFRQMENEAVREISKAGDMVVACGGGTVLRQENVEAFHENGSLILFLDVPLRVLQERLKTDTTRPLLQKPDRNKVIADLYRQRIAKYRRAADVTVHAIAPFWIVAKKVAAIGNRLLENPEENPEKT